MRKLSDDLDAALPGAVAKLARKNGGIGEVAAALSLGVGLKDRGQHAHFVCPGCGLDFPGDMLVKVMGRGYLCTGCLEGLYRRGRVRTRREAVALAYGVASPIPLDYWDQPAKGKSDVA